MVDPWSVEVDAAELGGVPQDTVGLVKDRLALQRQDGGFVLQDTATGETYAAEPGRTGEHLLARNAVAAGSLVFYSVLEQGRSTLWVNAGRGRDYPALSDDLGSVESFDTDGTSAAWTLRPNASPERIELWTAEVTESGLRAARFLRTLPTPSQPQLRVGAGWIVVRESETEVHLVQVRDGAEHSIPAAPGLGWQGGRSGSALAAGRLWLKAYRTQGPGNDARYLVRFELP
jgi:hypothetical protein